MRLTLPAAISALVSGGYSFASYSAINTPLDFYLITAKGIKIELSIESLEQQNKTQKAPKAPLTLRSIDTAFISPSPSINNNQQHELPDSWHTSKENYYSLTFSPDFMQLYTLGSSASSTSRSSPAPTPTPQLHSHNLGNLATLPFADLNEHAPIMLSSSTQLLPDVPQAVAVRTITRTMGWLKAYHQPFYEALQMTLDHDDWHLAYGNTGINFSDQVLTALDTVIQDSRGLKFVLVMKFIRVLVRSCHVNLLWKIKNTPWLTSLLRLYLSHPFEMAAVINVAESVALHLQTTHNLSAQAHNMIVIHMIALIAQQTEAEHGAFTQLIHTHNPQMAFWISMLGDEQMVAMLLGDFTLSASFQETHQQGIDQNLSLYPNLVAALFEYLTSEKHLQLPENQARLILHAYLLILKNHTFLLHSCSIREITCAKDTPDLVLKHLSSLLASQQVAPNILANLVFNPCLLQMATVLLKVLTSHIAPLVMSKTLLQIMLFAPFPINDLTPLVTVSLWGLNALGQANSLCKGQVHVPGHIEIAILAVIRRNSTIRDNEQVRQTMYQIYHLMSLYQQELLLQESDSLETLQRKIKTFLENLFMGAFMHQPMRYLE